MDVEKIIEKLKKIKPHTWVSLVMILVVLANYVLTAMGRPLINLGEEEITYAVNTILNLIFIGYAAYKNNSITEKAQLSDEILYALRDGKIDKEELEQFINNHKSPDVPTEDVAKIEAVETTEVTDEEVKG